MAKTGAKEPSFARRIMDVIGREGGKPLSPEDCEILKKLIGHLYGDRVPSGNLAKKILQSLEKPNHPPNCRGTREYVAARERCVTYMREYRAGDLNVDPDPFHLNPPESKFS